MKKVMLDFETFSSGQNALVVQIGACYFDTDGGIGEAFKCNVDAEDAQRNGATIEASTVYWWMTQSEQARTSIATPSTELPRLPEVLAFNFLNDFLAKAEEIWSHSTFDFVILMETLKRLKIKPKFGYRAARDIRTLMVLANYKSETIRDGVHHDALDDARYQAVYCMEAMQKLRSIALQGKIQ